MTLVWVGALSLLLSLLATAVYLPLARRLQQLDAPNHRSAHGQPTPSSGGVALIAALLACLALSQWLQWVLLPASVWWVLALVALLCAVGAMDDRRPLPVALRLLLFLVLSALVVWSFRAGLPLPLPLLPVLALALAWIVNATNFMDGIDGIAAAHTAITALALAAAGLLCGSAPAFPASAVAVGGVYAGFLCFNWQPARLFMGDAGSLCAGMLLGWLGLWGWSTQGLHPVLWLLPMSPFLVDTAVTLLLRWVRGERLTEAHSSHCYQRLARHWRSHARVVLALIALHVGWLLPLLLLVAAGWLNPWLALLVGLLPQALIVAKAGTLE